MINFFKHNDDIKYLAKMEQHIQSSHGQYNVDQQLAYTISHQLLYYLSLQKAWNRNKNNLSKLGLQSRTDVFSSEIIMLYKVFHLFYVN